MKKIVSIMLILCVIAVAGCAKESNDDATSNICTAIFVIIDFSYTEQEIRL